MRSHKETFFNLPDNPDTKEITPWEKMAADRIKRYSKAGLALRGLV